MWYHGHNISAGISWLRPVAAAVEPAGVTSSQDCILCQAGTYWTVSGHVVPDCLIEH
jgi:hypothetical protein